MFIILAELEIFMYIKAYSEPMAYSGIFKTIDIFSQFQARYSGITQEQFMLILNFIQADSGIFRTLAYLGTHIQAYSQSYILGYIYRGILSHIRVYFSRFRHIQDPCITDPNSVNQHLLFKSGSSFKSLFKSWNIFSFLFQKQTFNILLFRIAFQ